MGVPIRNEEEPGMKKRIVKAGMCIAAASIIVLPTTAQAAPEPTATADADMSSTLAGKTVFLDPGHQGTNHSENLARQVDDGRGGTKDCQTTGMATMGGVPEHTITWNVAQLVKTSLESLGAKVVLSRNDDSGWGGCVDERAKAASNSGAAVAISIHADGAPAEGHGFHFIVPALPIPNAKANEVQSVQGLAASKAVRDAYVKNGFSPANYAGVQDGLQTRSDVAGPALTTIPDVFVEMGNGQNPDDAKLLETGDGQLKHAIAITTGLVGYLLGQPVTKSPVRAAAPSTTSESSTSESSAAEASPMPTTTSTPSAAAASPMPTTTSTPTAAMPTAKPGAYASTPTTTTTTTTAPLPKTDGLVSTVASLIKPLLAAIGLDTSDSFLGDAFGTGSDLVEKLLAIVLSSGAPTSNG